jgi:hypothetical protein
VAVDLQQMAEYHQGVGPLMSDFGAAYTSWIATVTELSRRFQRRFGVVAGPGADARPGREGAR